MTTNNTLLHSITVRLPNKDIKPTDHYVRDRFGRGDLILEKYHVFDYYGQPTGEADVYFCDFENEKVAVKVYKEGFELEEKTRERIYQINSPYVIQVIDYGYLNKRYYEVMPYYKNGTLIDNIERIDYKFLTEIIIPNVNEGLKAIHDEDLTHRDIKPHNIFLSDDMKSVIIADFGVVKALDKRKYVTNMDPLSAKYAAPESITGKGISSKKSDYYSLGVSLIHLALKRDPDDGISDEDVRKQRLYRGIMIPDEVNSDLKGLIGALLVTNPDKRAGYDGVTEWLKDHTYFKQYAKRAFTDKYSMAGFEFNNVEYFDTREFAQALNDNWSSAMRYHKNDYIMPHIKQSHKEIYMYINDVLGLLENPEHQLSLIVTLLNDSDEILSKGNNPTFQQQLEIFKEDFYSSNDLDSGMMHVYMLAQMYLLDSNETKKIIEKLVRNMKHKYFHELFLLLFDYDSENIYFNHKKYSSIHSFSNILLEEEFTVNRDAIQFINDKITSSVFKFKYTNFVGFKTDGDELENVFLFIKQYNEGITLRIKNKKYHNFSELIHYGSSLYGKTSKNAAEEFGSLFKQKGFKQYLTHQNFTADVRKAINKVLKHISSNYKPSNNAEYLYLLCLYLEENMLYQNNKINCNVKDLKELNKFLVKQKDIESVAKIMNNDVYFTYWLSKLDHITFFEEVKL